MYCVVYDITNRNSFKNCGLWLEQLSQSRGDHNIFGRELFIHLIRLNKCVFSGVLVANKTDKENYRMVSTQEGKQLATSRKLGFFECSAVNNNHNNIFCFDSNDICFLRCLERQ